MAMQKTLGSSKVIIDGLHNVPPNPQYLETIRKSGCTAINVTIAVPVFDSDLAQAMHEIYDWHQRFFKYADKILHVTSVTDIERAKRERKTGIIFGFQDLNLIGKDLKMLTIFKELQVKIAVLAYNQRNYVGDGCFESTNCGLSSFGKEVVQEMNRLGMVIDLSHVGMASAMDAIRLSKDPVVFSHSNPYSLCDHPRNVRDEVIKAMAEKGGVIGICAHPMIVARKSSGIPRTLERILDHFDYVIKLVGIDYVGFGSDYFPFTINDAIEMDVSKPFLARLQNKNLGDEDFVDPRTFEIIYPTGLEDISKLPNLIKGLGARGYSRSEVNKILGGNFLRIFKEVWR
jgi:membrane dipeptidase